MQSYIEWLGQHLKRCRTTVNQFFQAQSKDEELKQEMEDMIK